MPVQVHNLMNVVAIAGGSGHSVAVRTDGTAWAWGSNQRGELGDNTTMPRPEPVQVHNLTGVVAVAAGWLHSRAVKGDGTAWAWGINDYGQLGDNTTTERHEPVQVHNLTGVVAIAGGSDHCLAIVPQPPPDPPTGVAASDGAHTDKVAVTWDASPGATSYEVWRHMSDDSASATHLAASVIPTRYDDTTAMPGVLYHYWVKAANAGGTSAFSASDSGLRAGAPASLCVDDSNTSGQEDGSEQRPYDTIQEAIAAAAEGGVVKVAQGIYRDTGGDVVAIQNKTVLLRGGYVGGSAYPEPGDFSDATRDWDVHPTIIDGEDARRCVRFDLADGELSGFTVTLGHADNGAGMHCSNASPTLTDVTFSGNQAYSKGGGMYNSQSSPTLTNVTFNNNQATRDGGGMYNSYSTNPTLTDVALNGNQSDLDGGGIYNFRSSPTLTHVTFTGNQARYGGGMRNEAESSPTLTDVTFNSNQASGSGGGMVNAAFSSPTLTNVTFSANQSDLGGGGIYNLASSPTLTHVTFTGNQAMSGAGMDNSQSSPTLTHVTLAGNRAAHSGGAMLNRDTSAVTLVNSILWANEAWTGPEIRNDGTSSATVTYSDIQGGYPGTGNLDADPLFADPGHWDDNGTLGDPSDDTWVQGDYHLQSPAGRWDPATQQWVTTDTETSPCIDAGDPTSPVGDEPLPNGGRINQGAYGGTTQASKAAGPPSIAHSPASLAPECDEGQGPPGETIQVWNAGGETLDYSIGDDVAWIASIDPSLGSSMGQHNDHAVQYASSGLQPGAHAGQITITGNADNSPQQVGVTLTVNNVLPTVTIDNIQPNPADPRPEGVHFDGTAQDAVGVITRYEWRSDIHGVLGDQEDCIYPLDTITVGTHQITFEAWDDDGTSSTATDTLVVTNAPPTASLGAPTPNPVSAGEMVSVEVGGHDNDESQQSLTEGRLKLDGAVVTTVPAGQGPPYPKTLEFAAPASPGDFVLTWEVRDDEGAWSTAFAQTLHVPEPPKAPGQAEFDLRFMVNGNPNPDAPGATSLCLRGIDPNGNPNDVMYALKTGADENSGWFEFGAGADKDDLFPTSAAPVWLTAAQLQDVRLRGLPAGVVCDYYARVRNAAGQETDTTGVMSCGTNRLGDVNRSGLPTALDYAYVRLAILTDTFSWYLNMDGNRIIDARDLAIVRDAVLHPLTGD